MELKDKLYRSEPIKQGTIPFIKGDTGPKGDKGEPGPSGSYGATMFKLKNTSWTSGNKLYLDVPNKIDIGEGMGLQSSSGAIMYVLNGIYRISIDLTFKDHFTYDEKDEYVFDFVTNSDTSTHYKLRCANNKTGYSHLTGELIVELNTTKYRWSDFYFVNTTGTNLDHDLGVNDYPLIIERLK